MPLPHFQTSAADPASAGEANFSMSSVVPCTVEAATATGSRHDPRRLPEAAVSLAPYFQIQSVILGDMTSGFLSCCPEGPGTQPGRAWELKPHGVNFDQWRKPIDKFLLFSSSDGLSWGAVFLQRMPGERPLWLTKWLCVLKLWPSGQPLPDICFFSFLVSLPFSFTLAAL